MRFPIFPADLSQIPKKGVVTASSLCHKPPSAGRRRWTSFDVRLVFQLCKASQFIAPDFISYQTYPVVTEQNLPSRVVRTPFDNIVSKVARLTYPS